jgi:hypothetical protein
MVGGTAGFHLGVIIRKRIADRRAKVADREAIHEAARAMKAHGAASAA